MTPPEPEPQSILAPITEAAIFLTLCVDAGGEDVVTDLLPDLGGLRRSVGFCAPSAGLSCVVGIGSDLWDRLFGAPRPAGLHPFRELKGARHAAPATPRRPLHPYPRRAARPLLRAGAADRRPADPGSPGGGRGPRLPLL